MRMRSWTLSLLCVATGVLLGANAAPAAAAAGAAWLIWASAEPTNFSQQDDENCAEGLACDRYDVTVMNVGGAPASGPPIVVRDRLPQGVVAVGCGEEEVWTEKRPEAGEGYSKRFGSQPECSVQAEGSLVTVTFNDSEHPVQPGEVVLILIEVMTTTKVGSLPASVRNVVEVEGGGAPVAATTMENTVNGEEPAFGMEDFGVGVLGPEGTPDVQAGDHPATIATTIDFRTTLNSNREELSKGSFPFLPVQVPKTQLVRLPLGLVGDPLAAAQCSEAAVIARLRCPPAARSGSSR